MLLKRPISQETYINKVLVLDTPYASEVGSLLYAQVCTRPDIAYDVGLLGRYHSNPGTEKLLRR